MSVVKTNAVTQKPTNDVAQRPVKPIFVQIGQDRIMGFDRPMGIFNQPFSFCPSERPVVFVQAHDIGKLMAAHYEPQSDAPGGISVGLMSKSSPERVAGFVSVVVEGEKAPRLASSERNGKFMREAVGVEMETGARVRVYLSNEFTGLVPMPHSLPDELSTPGMLG